MSSDDQSVAVSNPQSEIRIPQSLVGGGVWESNPPKPALAGSQDGFEDRAAHQNGCASPPAEKHPTLRARRAACQARHSPHTGRRRVGATDSASLSAGQFYVSPSGSRTLDRRTLSDYDYFRTSVRILLDEDERGRIIDDQLRDITGTIQALEALI
jgi:hypothetical protein